ncbi:hypothetical protein I7I53_01368 [Histoplasma capsulatum var. duboisii H88]|uniref:Uncharacterized protein n=1 Tax=Ajellomyces capsulatus (strain H88) TaxID=544711 RepID=A0A8A1LHU2_AJEC8|nr:hypothetical protein I7I53_01368 [Histoplasma capsulatum var. duboisii H88]
MQDYEHVTTLLPRPSRVLRLCIFSRDMGKQVEHILEVLLTHTILNKAALSMVECQFAQKELFRS